MTRGLIFLPFAVLLLLAALFAFRQGYIFANLTETDVINHYAARYLSEVEGASTKDCVATPGRAPVWIIVTCTPAQGPAKNYHVNRRGLLVDRANPGDPEAKTALRGTA